MRLEGGRHEGSVLQLRCIVSGQTRNTEQKVSQAQVLYGKFGLILKLESGHQKAAAVLVKLEA